MKVSEFVGDNIRSLRRVAGLTQAELAEAMQALGFRWLRQTVAETEAGRRDATVEELVALAAYFEMPLQAILVAPGGQLTFETAEVGSRSLTVTDWIGLIEQSRTSLDPASKRVQHAIDSLVGSLPRPWARRWRRKGGGPGEAFVAARDERLRTRAIFPGPIFVWEGEGDLETSTVAKPWGTSVRVRLRSGVPYVARDETEAERLRETTQTHPELRVITRQEAYRLRRRKES